MKLMLIAINSQYIHSNPALYYLKQSLTGLQLQVELCEYSINMPISSLLCDISQHQPDIVSFSTYIWNIEYTIKLIKDVALLLPDCKIILGGPEASARANELIAALPQIYAVIVGEGENIWPQLAADLLKNRQAPLAGVVFRQQKECRPAPRVDFAALPFIYDENDLQALAIEKKIIYYESSRGCPYGCVFCASATEPLRERPLDKVLPELQILSQYAGQIKFVDRTFNASPKRAAEIIAALSELYRPGLSWHFEISPYILTPEIISLLVLAPVDYFRLEAGVQSLNSDVLEAIHRGGDWQRAKAALIQIIAADNVHIHLDLIAGLPQETPDSFARAFAEIHQMAPHYLQLGFLKVLPGSLLSKTADEQGIVYSATPPYRVLATPTMPADYLFKLNHAEQVLNAFYNSGHFRQTLHNAAKLWPGGALQFYFDLAAAKLQITAGSLSLPRKAELLAQLLLPVNEQLFFDLLRMDWLGYGDGQPLPTVLRHPKDSKNKFFFYRHWQIIPGNTVQTTGQNCYINFDLQKKTGVSRLCQICTCN